MSNVEITKELIDEMCDEIVYLREEKDGAVVSAKEEIDELRKDNERIKELHQNRVDDLNDAINDLELDIKKLETLIIEKDETIKDLKKENEITKEELNHFHSTKLAYMKIDGYTRLVQFYKNGEEQRYRTVI